MNSRPARIDLAGVRFGRYTAVSYAGNSAWNCVCDCGVKRAVSTSNLRRGTSNSCGCMKPAKSRAAATRHGLSGTPTYSSWLAMRQRCLNPNSRAYENYGGRGITICARWETFEAFFADMGAAPALHEIERDDVNGNYEPGNCRWATQLEQANNTRRNRFVTHNGKTQTVAQWARDLGLKVQTLYRRLFIYNMPAEEALNSRVLGPSEYGKRGADARWAGKTVHPVRVPPMGQGALFQ